MFCTNEKLRVCLDDEEILSLLCNAAENFARGDIPNSVTWCLMSAMTALEKRDGGVRGIATGTSFRKLVAKVLARWFSKQVEEACAPFQFALSTREDRLRGSRNSSQKNNSSRDRVEHQIDGPLQRWCRCMRPRAPRRESLFAFLDDKGTRVLYNLQHNFARTSRCRCRARHACGISQENALSTRRILNQMCGTPMVYQDLGNPHRGILCMAVLLQKMRRSALPPLLVADRVSQSIIQVCARA